MFSTTNSLIWSFISSSCVQDWAYKNNLEVNLNKTKETVMEPPSKIQHLPPLQFPVVQVERVNSAKSLSINSNADFSWKSHVEAITSKATQNLFSKAMVCGHSQPQLLHFYTGVIRPIGMFGITWSRELKWTKSKLSKNRSSAVAEMGDRGHNRHGPKRGGCCAPFVESWDPV